VRSVCHYFTGVIVLAVVIAARSEEGGAGHYAPGSFASFIDTLPGTPSLSVFNYFTYYNGSAGAGRQLEIAGLVAANVSATSYADALGAFWVTPLKILGAYYVPGISLPFVWTDVKAQISALGRTASRSDSVGGLGDIEFWPVALSWSALNNDLHVDFFGGIYAPTGAFHNNRLANDGLGYWTFEPGVMVSYLGQKNGFELST
jgi:hypothetical protein